MEYECYCRRPLWLDDAACRLPYRRGEIPYASGYRAFRREGSRALLPALAALWREGAMYTGVSSMLLRAVPVHLAYLPVYGLLMTMMRGAS